MKYWKSVLLVPFGGVVARNPTLILENCKTVNGKILKSLVPKDHVELLAVIPPRFSASKYVGMTRKILKKLFFKNPRLSQQVWELSLVGLPVLCCYFWRCHPMIETCSRLALQELQEGGGDVTIGP